MKIRSLLLAGGAGTRLWPLSTEERPKQFLTLWGGKSLLRETRDRLAPLGDVFVATGRRYRDMTLADLPGMSPDRLILEPCRRNTAPAILSAALRFAREGDEMTAVVPADQTVSDPEAFRRALRAAADAAERGRAIATLGIVPVRPETEFGYIETDPDPVSSAAARVRRFVEKPDLEAAKGYLAAGNFAWNAGIFVFRPSALLSESERVAPELLEACRRYDARTGDEADEAYGRVPSISFDYAIMEKAENIFCVPCDAGWNDVGSYRALGELLGSDEYGNLIIAPRSQPVVTVGISDSVVAATEEGILVFAKSKENELREALQSRPAGPR